MNSLIFKTKIMKNLYIFIISFFLFINISNSQDSWQPLNGPDGVIIQQIGTDLFGNYYINTDGGKYLFRSSDEGATWNYFGNDLPSRYYNGRSFVNAPDSSMYFLVNHKLFVLKPHSSTWEPIELKNNNKVYLEEISISPNGYIYLASDKEVLLSTDNGKSFQLIFTGSYHKIKLATYGNNNNFMLINNIGTNILYSFDDDGKNKKKIQTYPWSMGGVFFDPNSNKLFSYYQSKFFVSNNKGQSWEKKAIANAHGYDYATISPDKTIYCSTGSGIYFSKSLGESWEKIPDEINPFRYSVKTILFPKDGNKLLLGNDLNDFNLGITKDNFGTIKEIKTKIKQAHGYNLSKDNNGIMIINIFRSKYLLSKDDWQTWEEIPFNIGTEKIKELAHFKDGDIFIISSKNRVYKSSDYGINWKNITPQNGNQTRYYTISINPVGKLYLTSNRFELFVSSDIGETWTIKNNSKYLDGVLHFHPNGYIYNVDFSNISVSHDDGVTWNNLLPNNQFGVIGAFHIAKNGEIYFAAERYTPTDYFFSIWKLENNNFVKIPGPEEYFLPYSIESNLAGDLFTTSDGFVYKTSNNGKNWENITNNLPKRSVAKLFIDQEQYLYTVPYQNVIYKSKQTTINPHFVKGEVYYDKNNNCIKDIDEPLLPDWEIVLNDGNIKQIKKSKSDGSFWFFIPNGEYHAKLKIPNTNLWTICENDIEISLNSSIKDTTNISFALQAIKNCSNLNVEASTTMLRKGFSDSYIINYCNNGTNTAKNVIIEIELDAFLIFENSSIPIYSQTGNLLHFKVDNIGINECGSFKIQVKVSTEGKLGYEHCINTTIDSDNTGNDCTDIQIIKDSLCLNDLGSMASTNLLAFINNKKVDNLINRNKRIRYVIKFQNTGTYNASNIFIVDTMSPYLDLQTLKIEKASDSYKIERAENNILKITFNKVMLPDSNKSKRRSKGYIDFSIAQKKNLPYKTEIINSASVYFDYNSAVKTNTIKLTIANPLGINNLSNSTTIKIYPQPFSYKTKIAIENVNIPKKSTFEVYDKLGKIVFKKVIESNVFDFYRKDLPIGIYFIKLSNKGKILGTNKLVIQ